MSFTLTNNSQLSQPVYNPFYFTTSSSNTTQPNYKFLFDIYLNNSGSTNLGRIKLYPRPGTNTCIFSPARVLESNVSYDLTQSVTGITSSTNDIIQYWLNFGEEYGDPSAGTGTTISVLTSTSGYCWNAVLTYQQYPSYSSTTYLLSGVTGQFLTNAPSTQLIKNNERASITFLNQFPLSFNPFDTNASNFVKYIQVTTYQITGGTSVFNVIDVPNSGATLNQSTANLIQHFGSGIWNLNNVPTSIVEASSSTSTGPIINVITDKQYTIQAVYGTGNTKTACSQLKTFSIDTSCPVRGFSPVRLMFLNRLGGFDYFTFTLLSRTNINLERQQYKKPLAWNYVVGDRQNTIINTNVTKLISVTSDWVSQLTSNWLEELFESKEVYELQTDGTPWPVILDGTSFEIKKTVNDRLINYEFSYTYSFDINTQRG